MKIDDPALMAVFLADLDTWNQRQPGPLPSVVACGLIDRGYPESLAVRVALAPPFVVAQSAPWYAERPGREIAESIERNTPRVVQALLYGTLAERGTREAVSP